ncbi:MAG: hypothetical protein ACLFSU_04770 [Acholeplasmataceae bacterium]
MDIILLVLKNGLIALVFMPLIFIHHRMVYKEEKQLKAGGVLIAYIIAVAILVIIDLYG